MKVSLKYEEKPIKRSLKILKEAYKRALEDAKRP